MRFLGGTTEFPRREAKKSSQNLRSWEASDGSLRNFTGKTQKKGNCPQCSFASFGVSFRALSGASSDVPEEVSVFRLFRHLPGRKPEEDEEKDVQLDEK